MEQKYSHTGNCNNASKDGECRITQEHTGPTFKSLPDVGSLIVAKISQQQPAESTASRAMPSYMEDEVLKTLSKLCLRPDPTLTGSYALATFNFDYEFNMFLRNYGPFVFLIVTTVSMYTGKSVLRLLFPYIVFVVVIFPLLVHTIHPLFVRARYCKPLLQFHTFSLSKIFTSEIRTLMAASIGFLMGFISFSLFSFLISNTHITWSVVFARGLLSFLGLFKKIYSNPDTWCSFARKGAQAFLLFSSILGLSLIFDHYSSVPAPRLVGIEPNPGPFITFNDGDSSEYEPLDYDRFDLLSVASGTISSREQSQDSYCYDDYTLPSGDYDYSGEGSAISTVKRSFSDFAFMWNGTCPYSGIYAFTINHGHFKTDYLFKKFLFRCHDPDTEIFLIGRKKRFGQFFVSSKIMSEIGSLRLNSSHLAPLPCLDVDWLRTPDEYLTQFQGIDNYIIPLENTYEAHKFLNEDFSFVSKALSRGDDQNILLSSKGIDQNSYWSLRRGRYDEVRILDLSFHTPKHSIYVPFLERLLVDKPEDVFWILENYIDCIPSVVQVNYVVEDCRDQITLGMNLGLENFRFQVGVVCFTNDAKGYKKILVCIETNPGPNSLLLSYLKKMESLPTSDSTRSSRSNFHRNLDKQKRKINDKMRQFSERNLSLKRNEYVGEGLFDVGIDEESRNFIGEAIGQIREVFSQGANLKVDLGLQGALIDIISGAKKVGGFIYDFIIYLLKAFIDLIPEHIADVVSSILSLLVGDIFDLPDVARDNEYVGEGIISESMFAAYSMFLSKYIPESDMISLWKSGLKYKNLVKDSVPMFSWFFGLLKKTIFYLNEKFPSLISLPGCLFSSDITFYFKSLQIIREGIRSGDVPPHQLAMMVYALQDKIEMDFKENPKTNDSASYSYLLSTISSLSKYFESHVSPRSGCRCEPLGIMTTGPTNVGKSTFTMPLLLAILARTKEGQDLKDFVGDHYGTVFFRIALNEFWDGMLPLTHKVIVYDDFGQLTDSVGTPSMDALEWIRLKNTAPCHLHYSNISDKMKHYANPEILFGSTNRPFMKFDSIICNEALIRRFDLPVCQVPKVAFCVDSSITSNPWTRRMDMEKVRAAFPLDPLDASTYADSSVLEYIEWDFHKGCPKLHGFVLSFDELVERAASMLKGFQTRGKHMLNYHNHIKEKFANITLDEEKECEVRVVPPIDEPSSPACMKLLNSLICKVESEQSTYEEMYNSALSHWKPISSTLLMICGATSLYSALSNWKMESPGRGQPTKKGGKKAYNGGKVKYVIQPSKDEIDFGANAYTREGGDCGQQADYLYKIARRNQYYLTINGEEKPVCQVTFITERIFILPRHSFESCLNHYENQTAAAGCDVQFTLELHGMISKQIEISFELSDIYAAWGHESKDLTVVKLPRETCRLHSNIIGAFLSEEESNSNQIYNAHILYHRGDIQSHVLCPISVSYGSCEYNADGAWNARLHYNAPSIPADCGAPVVCQDPRFARPVILGYHIAGRNGIMVKSCLGVEIFKEDLEGAIKYLKGELDFVEKFPNMEKPPYELEGFCTYGEVPSVFLPSKTNLEPTPFFGKITEVTTYPAKLAKFTRNGITIDPSELARDKYIHPEVAINRESLLRAIGTVSKMVLPTFNSAPWEPKVLSFEEAICGIPGVSFVDAINRSTSPGYPFVLNRKLPGKKDWLGTAEPTDLNCSQVQSLKSEILEVIDCMKRGERLFFPYVDHLKDERRSKEKVDQGKTRQFMVGNMHLTIIIKMYFGDFIRHICENRIKNGIAIGMDPYTEWDMLHTYMTGLSESLMTAGDYSAYDAKIPVPISMGASQVSEAFYFTSIKDDRKVREMVMQEIINSCHIYKGIVYFYNGGNPSGQGMTTVHNSVCGLLMLVYIAYVSSDITEATLLSNSRFMVFGDDNLISYRAVLAQIFEQESLTILMKRYLNMSYTVETKDGSVVSGRTIWEVNFLKRGFLRVRGVITSPIELGVILETLNWQKKNSTVSQMRERIDGFFCELSQHGRIVFEEWAPSLNRLANQYYEYSSIYADYYMAFNGHINYDFF